MKKLEADTIIELLKSINTLLTQLTFHVLKEDSDRKIKEKSIIQKSNTTIRKVENGNII
jgi:hypothetical protein